MKAYAAAFAVIFLAGSAFAQGIGMSRYETMYGSPVDVSLDDLVQNSAPYENRAVRTKGRLDIEGTGRDRVYALRAAFGGVVVITPVPEIAGLFESEGGLRWIGQQIDITGVFTVNEGTFTQYRFQIQFWSFEGPPEKEAKGPIKATDLTLEQLVTRPGRHDGQTVRVVGKFRGRNLYGDMPSKSGRDSDDWVIKNDVFAVWVTGKKPKGSGWVLDSGLKRDTGKWIEVVGRPETRGGVTYVRAMQLALTSPPTPTAEAQPPPPPPEKPKVPPVVVFALPLDGEAEVPEDSRFVVQFSKDMDEQTFKGHVVLRYVGPVRPGDRTFEGLRLSYDGGRRALTVDPGDVLRPGRQIELLLLPGIADVDGLQLIPRPGRQIDGAVDLLHFQTGL
jgi:hypothetical protein